MLVKKPVKVIEAEYVTEADAILMICECDKGQLRHQIHSSAFEFGGRDKVTEMIKTAELFVGSTIEAVFDDKLEDKIAKKKPLDY